MEIEKPFKCTVCGANFTNEDHLQVHKRKHEMSLTLGKTSHSTTLESFTDETPTPTRFFQNCEEVGLFQDLQSVNPFDEQFSKATTTTTNASGTTNISNSGGGHGPFDFSLAISSSSASTSTVSSLSSSSSTANNSSGVGSSSKRRYSDQDTLNTPQVFGYIVNATSSTTNTCSTSSVLTPMPPASSTALDVLTCCVKDKESHNNSDGDIECAGTVATKLVDVKPARSVPTSASVLMRNGSSNAIINRNKTKLKLNLSPNVIPVPSLSARTLVSSTIEISDQPKSKKCNISVRLKPEKKAELLERNRAAAVRSRERRKQWVSNLESKCTSYESLISQLRAQVSKQNTELQLLKCELNKHSNCDVTIKGNSPPSTVQHQHVQLYVHQQTLQMQQPNILRSPASVPLVVTTVPSHSSTSDSHVTPASTVPNRARRGRPRKGQERRVNIVSVPASLSPGIPLKIQLVPLNRSRPQRNDKNSSLQAVGL